MEMKQENKRTRHHVSSLGRKLFVCASLLDIRSFDLYGMFYYSRCPSYKRVFEGGMHNTHTKLYVCQEKNLNTKTKFRVLCKFLIFIIFLIVIFFPYTNQNLKKIFKLLYLYVYDVVYK